MDIALTTDHDLQVSNFDLSLLTGVEAIRQRILIHLLTFKGEWFLDTDRGVPYYQTIFQKGITKEVVDSVIRQEITKVPGVKSISSFTSTHNNSTRAYTCTFVVISTMNETIEVIL